MIAKNLIAVMITCSQVHYCRIRNINYQLSDPHYYPLLYCVQYYVKELPEELDRVCSLMHPRGEVKIEWTLHGV